MYNQGSQDNQDQKNVTPILTLDQNLVAKHLDSIETKRITQEINNDLGWFPQLLSTFGLSGRWGFALVTAVSLMAYYIQYNNMNQDETFIPSAPTIPAMPFLTLPNVAMFFNALLAAGSWSSAHNSSVIIDKSKSAVSTGSGPYAVRLLTSYMTRPPSELLTVGEVQGFKSKPENPDQKVESLTCITTPVSRPWG